MPQPGDAAGAAPFYSGFEFLFNFLRGIKGSSIDLRRRPEEIEKGAAEIERFMAGVAKPNYTKGRTPGYAFDIFYPLLSHSILTAKQFEKLVFPKLREMGEYLKKYDKTCLMFVESNSERFYDFFNELPSGCFAFYTELNDVFEMKKAMNGKCMVGGMPVDMLANSTPEKCIDYARKLVSELGAGGGYIYSQNKMISFPNDIKAENQLAVNKYLNCGQ